RQGVNLDHVNGSLSDRSEYYQSIESLSEIDFKKIAEVSPESINQLLDLIDKWPNNFLAKYNDYADTINHQVQFCKIVLNFKHLLTLLISIILTEEPDVIGTVHKTSFVRLIKKLALNFPATLTSILGDVKLFKIVNDYLCSDEVILHAQST